MAGFFHQLAAQALRPAVRIYPITALPRAEQHGFEETQEQAFSNPGIAVPTANEPSAGEHELRVLSSEPDEQRSVAEREPPDPERETRAGPRVPAPREDEKALDHRPSELTPARSVSDPPPRIAPRPSATRKEPTALRPGRPQINRPSWKRDHLEPISRDTRADANSPPDVHIHIGRIELTAVTPPAPNNKRTPTGKKPMSLDEYLQGRRRKAS